MQTFLTGIFFIILCTGCSSKNDLQSQSCAGHLTEGYTDRVSYLPGDSVKIYLHASRPLEMCRLNIFNVNGDSVFSVASPLPFHPKYPWNVGSTNGFNYPLTSEFVLPEIPSGVYLIENKIPFIVKTKKRVDVTVVYPSNTANAYSFSGGKNLYSPGTTQVSFQRPIELQPYSQFCLRWLEKQSDFTIGYTADVDLEEYENISSSKIVTIIGHSEYWTRNARINFDRFVDGGGHAIVLSGNTMWWQVRYSDDRTTMICFRRPELDSVADKNVQTVEWNDTSFNYPVIKSIGADFAHGGYGKEEDSGWDGYKIIAENSPLLKGTDLKDEDIISLPTLEYDGTLLAGFDKKGFPILDNKALGFHKAEIVGFDKAYRWVPTTPTFIVFQKTPKSGIIINAGSIEWCGAGGMGGASAEAIKKITMNSIRNLLNGDSVFSDENQASKSPNP
jgi:hypothetical protein